MAERLTPEQLEDIRVATLNKLSPDRTTFHADVSYALRQAARDARTLQRVQAWTEEEAPSIDNPNLDLETRGWWRGEAECKSTVAALLRAEDNETPMRRISAQIKEG